MCKVILKSGRECEFQQLILGLCTTHWKIYNENINKPLPLKYMGCFRAFKKCSVCNLKKSSLFHNIMLSMGKSSKLPIDVCNDCYKEYPSFIKSRWVDDT